MADVLNNNAVLILAKYILGLSPNDTDLYLGLFVSDYDFAADATPADFTECTLAGYARIELTAANWTVGTPAGAVVECSYGAVTFTLTSGGQTIYGHWIMDENAGGAIMWGQTWTTPFSVPDGGGVVKIFPFYNSEQCSG